jgi:hypothetical protein
LVISGTDAIKNMDQGEEVSIPSVDEFSLDYLDELKEDIILDKRMRTSSKGDVYYLQVGLKGTHLRKENGLRKTRLANSSLTYLSIDERFWLSKNLSVGRHDPKRIQRSLKITQNSQKHLRKLRMALADREREKIQSPRNLAKLESLRRAHRNIPNGLNESSNRARDKNIFVVKILVNLAQSAGMSQHLYY